MFLILIAKLRNTIQISKQTERKNLQNFVFNLRFLAIEITKVNFGRKYAEISTIRYIAVIQRYT